MSNNKQSSVAWLIEQLKEYDLSEEDDTYVIKIQSWVLTEKHEKAKAMHKEEIIHAYNQSWHFRDKPYETGKKHYNKTFSDESNN
jgi:hypothetical protein